jgi:hypothetical protein
VLDERSLDEPDGLRLLGVCRRRVHRRLYARLYAMLR